MALRLMTLAEIEQEYMTSRSTLMRYLKNYKIRGIVKSGKWYIPEYAVKQNFFRRDAGAVLEDFALAEMMEKESKDELPEAVKTGRC